MTSSRQFLPSVALLVAAAAWGSTVVVAKGAYESSMTPAHLLISRLTLTALCLLPAFLPHLRMKRETCVQGIILGLIFNTGLVLQMVGLEYTPPSLSGFITASYVVFTAILTPLIMKQATSGRTWIAVALTLAGIGILALGNGGGDVGFGFGAVITLLGAVLFALHIIFLGRWVKPETVQSLTLMQALTGAVGMLCFLPFADYQLPSVWDLWWPVLYLGIFCGAVTLFLQSWAQSYVPATASAVIMCSEPMWAAVFAIWAGMEELTWQVLTGGGLVVVALLLTAWPGRKAIFVDALVEELRSRRARRGS
ncbi:MAG: DMT family transporter [Propionibacterium sp.]|nr:DMT family transporter [Propionibacterium sp.]